MKPGDMVKINWPTDQGGPYEYRGKAASYADISIVRIDCTDVVVDSDWIKPVEPELEEGRLYYYWDNDDGGPNRRHSRAKYGNLLSKGWDHYEPVHRRWDELSEEEQYVWRTVGVSDSAYKLAYKLITGEEHP